MITLTKAQVRMLLAKDAGAERVSDAALARWFRVSQAAVSYWGEDDPIPGRRVLQAMTQRPDLFGQIMIPAANDDGPAAAGEVAGV